MKTQYTFEPGDRVIGPDGPATVEKADETRCLIVYDIRYGFGKNTPTEPVRAYCTQAQLRPEN